MKCWLIFVKYQQQLHQSDINVNHETLCGASYGRASVFCSYCLVAWLNPYVKIGTWIGCLGLVLIEFVLLFDAVIWFRSCKSRVKLLTIAHLKCYINLLMKKCFVIADLEFKLIYKVVYNVTISLDVFPMYRCRVHDASECFLLQTLPRVFRWWILCIRTSQKCQT